MSLFSIGNMEKLEEMFLELIILTILAAIFIPEIYRKNWIAAAFVGVPLIVLLIIIYVYHFKNTDTGDIVYRTFTMTG